MIDGHEMEFKKSKVPKSALLSLETAPICLHQQSRLNSNNLKRKNKFKHHQQSSQKDSIHAIRTIRQVSICLVSSDFFVSMPGWFQVSFKND